MTQVQKLWPLLTATHHYDKSISTRGRGHESRVVCKVDIASGTHESCMQRDL